MIPDNRLEDRRLLLGVMGAAGIAAFARSANAGQLSPPPGPIKPTPGPEPRTPLSDETTPGDATAHFVISQPGSYYLQRSLTGSAVTRSAIRVAADNVTIDLNGFSIAADSTGIPGVLTFQTEPVEGLVIRNGTIRSWGGYVTLNPLFNSVFEDLRIIGPYAGNLEAAAQHCRFSRILVDSTGEVGISTLSDCIVEDCVVVKREDTPLGMFQGIQVALNTIVQRCAVARCGRGISAIGGIIRDCAVFDSVADSSWDDAAILISRATAENCVVEGGVRAGVRCTGSAAVLNCRVTACHIGIHDGAFAGGLNRIEGNTITHCQAQGLRIDKTRNLIVRNAASGNTGADYAIAPGNTVGEIIDGTSGVVLTASASPWANLRY